VTTTLTHLIDAARGVTADAVSEASRPCITCSFQLEDIVVLHILRALRPDVPVLFLDTVHHFDETYAYRDRVTRAWALNLIDLRANAPAPGLWQTSTDDCCRRHKVDPLFAALDGYDVWFTGLRREQSPSRAALEETEPFALPSGRTLRKISPLARWTTKDVWTYARSHDIEPLPLYADGYASIGCEPCTTLPSDPSNPRSGRWHGHKLECGIHVTISPAATSSPREPSGT
jgi:phosphoadenosine phosphosulfate reductase